MKKSHILTVILVLFLTFSLGVGRSTAQGTGPDNARQAALGTGFTYQGQLKTSSGSPITATCDFQFTLWDALSGSTQVGAASTVTGVSVVNGAFTAQVNAGGQFGATAFNGEARWLEIGVKCGSESTYTTLSPRQPLTPAPYALALPGLYTQPNAISPNIIGGYSGNTVTDGVLGATIGGGGMIGLSNQVSVNFGTVGGGSGNSTHGLWATVGGGANNTSSNNSDSVGGGNTNHASGGNATIGGGNGNTASGAYSIVGGGFYNTASGGYASVGGGDQNTASGQYATVSGGQLNVAAGGFSFAAGRQALASHAGTFVWADSTDASFLSTGADQFLIRAGGGVGINTNSPANGSLQVARDFTSSGGFGQIEATGATNPFKRLTLGFDTTHNLGWIQASITGTGYNNLALNPSGANVLIGTTTDSGDRLTVSGDIRVGTSGTNGCVKRFDGTPLAGSCSSDARLKQNVTAFPNMLDKVAQLQPVYYNWRAAEFPAYHFDSNTRSYGVIAQDVEKVLPELVGVDEQGFKTVNYSEIPMLLLQALKDLRTEKNSQISTQQKQIAALETRLSELEHGTTPGSAPTSPLSTPWPWLALVTIILGGMVIMRRQGARL